MDSYHVAAYIRPSLNHLSRFIDLRGARVLEIGGQLPPQLVIEELKAKSWVCVDDQTGWARSMGWTRRPGTSVSELQSEQIEAGWSCFDSSVHDVPAWANASFDHIVSFAALEHIPSVPKLIRRVRLLLRPGGSAWFMVGPIWSGHRGFHIFPRDFPKFADENRAFIQEVPPWQHLLMGPVEFHRWAQQRWGDGFADSLHRHVFESTRINRLRLSDYQLAFSITGLEVAYFQTWGRFKGDEAQLKKVQERYPQERGFEADGFAVLLRRPVP